MNLCCEYDKKIDFLLFNNKDVERLPLGILMFFLVSAYYIHIVSTYTDCIMYILIQNKNKNNNNDGCNVFVT